MKLLRGKLTYANVMATLAMFVALGGVSYAALKLPKNSVGTKQVKNGAITAAKIKDGSVNGAKIENGAVTGDKVQAASLGKVPSATNASEAQHAATADQALKATSAESADHAANSDQAANADEAADASLLRGQAPSAFFPAARVVSGQSRLGGPTKILALPGGLTLANDKLDINFSVTSNAEWVVTSETQITELRKAEKASVTYEFSGYIESFWARSTTATEASWSITCYFFFGGERDECIAVRL